MEDKKLLLDSITSIIGLYGSFTVADVEADTSPCIATMGQTHGLMESFYSNFGTVRIYADGYNLDLDYDIEYKDLDYDVLDEILVLAEKWEKSKIFGE